MWTGWTVTFRNRLEECWRGGFANIYTSHIATLQRLLCYTYIRRTVYTSRHYYMTPLPGRTCLYPKIEFAAVIDRRYSATLVARAGRSARRPALLRRHFPQHQSMRRAVMPAARRPGAQDAGDADGGSSPAPPAPVFRLCTAHLVKKASPSMMKSRAGRAAGCRSAAACARWIAVHNCACRRAI